MPVLSPWKLYQAYTANPGWFVDNAIPNLQQHLQNNPLRMLRTGTIWMAGLRGRF